MVHKIYLWFKGEAVLIISAAFAVFTMFFVKPSSEYIKYIDFRVLALLFSLMAVVAGLQENGVFLILSDKLLSKVKTVRGMCYTLILLCFLTSMWITNDVALITFVPFTVMMLKLTGKEKNVIFVIVMQTIAANLGSMLTPVGNPQNLYLYSYYKVNEMDFLRITMPLTIFSFLIISFVCLFVKGERINIPPNKANEIYKLQDKKSVDGKNILIYFILFTLCLGTVIHRIDYRITLLLILLFLSFYDRNILKKVDYSLLLTFICFFIFSGNIGNINFIHTLISETIKTREIMSAILLSQIISNVPSAVLLSNFTDKAQELIIGTNIGGLGTVIASLASLISYRIYCKTDRPNYLKYFIVFTVSNVGMLILLYLFQFYL
ncbi:citrate transporter [Anaerocolumna sedimenticola]|uniref:Citrate transporter n=1 Tax=Anaerocolumna sedimenticola TaxID=2696063 RepID=A0A6P1TQT1_9FIRM|nr:SLC13 family permease [Anaerocolumna sedimenticola]QHQ62707.1 citrate transporter [Anaerocolumna sedimenticola]